jgi:hypothetical protein
MEMTEYWKEGKRNSRRSEYPVGDGSVLNSTAEWQNIEQEYGRIFDQD